MPVRPRPSTTPISAYGREPQRDVRSTAFGHVQQCSKADAPNSPADADAYQPAANCAGPRHRRLEEVREQFDVILPSVQPLRRAGADAPSSYVPRSRSLLGPGRRLEEATPVPVASPPRLAQVRALSASSTSLRWAPSPLPSLPQLSLSYPHAPATSSPLRPSYRATLGPMARLQLGNSVYQRGNEHIKIAINHWLQALVEAEYPARAEVLEQRLALVRRRFRHERALLSLHLAWFTSDAHVSRKNFSRAITLDENLVFAFDQLLMRAYEQPVLQDVFQPLCIKFSALLPFAVDYQQLLAQSMREHDWEEAARHAAVLCEAVPHLLLPRCAQIATQVLAARKAKSVHAYPALADACREMMADVFALDGDGHAHASGSSSADDYKMQWGMFLGAYYFVEPTAFGAFHDAQGRLHEPATAKRTVAGLPWHHAMRMPFARTWADEVAAWRQAEAEAEAEAADARGRDAAPPA